jgi:hypothetical protein
MITRKLHSLPTKRKSKIMSSKRIRSIPNRFLKDADISNHNAQFKTKDELNIKSKTFTVYTNAQQSASIIHYYYYNDKQCERFFITNAKYIGIVIKSKFYVLNLINNTFANKIKTIINKINHKDIEYLINTLYFNADSNPHIIFDFETWKESENIYNIEKQIIFNAELSISSPIKELIWITQPLVLLQGLSEYGKKYNTRFVFNEFFKNFYYTNYQISLNQLQIVKPKLDSIFFNQLQAWKYYNNQLPEGVFAYNFGLYPEEIQPSGTCNFSMLKGKLLNFTLDNNFLLEYFDTTFNPNQLGLQLKFMARSYNFFVVEKGQAKMIFATN